MVCKTYEIKKGRILYRDELEFKTVFHEIFWKLMMKKRGCIIREYLNN